MNHRLVAHHRAIERKGHHVDGGNVHRSSIGHGSSNHIAVTDPSLSRRKFLITGAEAGFTLPDLGSSNHAGDERQELRDAPAASLFGFRAGSLTISLRLRRNGRRAAFSDQHGCDTEENTPLTVVVNWAARVNK